MKTHTPKVGVSPAFLISSYGSHFNPDNVSEAIERAAAWGFSNIQIEIFDNEKIALWLEGSGADCVRKAAEKLRMNISQLVGHLLIEDSASPSALFSSSGIETMDRLVTIADRLGCVESITLPIGAYSSEVSEAGSMQQFSDETLKKRLSEKLAAFYRPVEAAGYRLSVELLPNHVAGRYSGFAEIQKIAAISRLGLLFDTGHAIAAAEDVYAIPEAFKGSIFGTHLCDNFLDQSLKLAPGKGSIRWDTLLNSLVSSQYSGFFDIEIICSPDRVEEEYRNSLEFIRSRIH